MSSTAANPNARSPRRWGAMLERFGPLLALALLIAGTAVVEAIKVPADERAFLTARNFANILGQWSYVGIVAIGMTFVIILGGIDLSVGSMVALAAGAAVYAMNAAADAWGPGAGIAVAVLTSILGGAILGLGNGVVIAVGRIAPFVATLGTLAIYRSLVLAPAEGSEIRSTVSSYAGLGSANLSDTFRFLSPAWLWERLPESPAVAFWLNLIQLRVVVLVALVVAAHAVLRWTVFGRQVFAIGDNPRAARYAGVKVRRTTIAVYGIAGLTCGIAALLNSSRLNSVSSSTLGLYYELDAIAAVVIGGTRLQGGAGRVGGTLVGVLILGVISNMLNMLEVSNFYHGLVKGLIILAAVLVQPRKPVD